MEPFLLQLFIFLASAAIAVPISKRLGLGSVLGYLIAGIIIGPYGFSLIGQIEDVMHFTEFGVVMMLFLVGLELKPSMLWQMKMPILGMGGLQVLLTSLLIGAAAWFFLPWQQALAVGLTLSLSSTAIVLQTMKEKGLMETPVGKSVFSVLLFQDLAVIPILTVLPLLATIELHDDDHGGSHLFDISRLPGYLQFTVTLLAILAIFFIARYACRPMFRAIAKTQIREIFVAAALALVVGISLLMTAVGLSQALGTFLAGVVLADSEYRHELESDIEPFKGLLLGIFFISIGASLDFLLIGERILLIGGITLALLLIKTLVLLMTGTLFRMKGKDRSLFATALAQGGEFAFVLFQFTRSGGILPETVTEPLISAVAISMFLAPLLFLLQERFSSRRDLETTAEREPDEIAPQRHKVIMAGFGRLGTDTGRFLLAAGIRPVIIDHDAANIEILRKFGFEVYYGDITRLDLLESAGAAEAQLLVITISDSERALTLVGLAAKHYPDLKIVMTAADRSAAYDLMDHGVQHIRRETFGAALELGRDALSVLGYDPYETYRMMRTFRKKDEKMLPELYRMHREDEESYVSMYRRQQAEMEELMSLDMISDLDILDSAWGAGTPDRGTQEKAPEASGNPSATTTSYSLRK